MRAGNRVNSAAEIAEHLGARKSGAGYLARCPAHADTNPSLSISESRDGKLLLHCHAGCDFETVIAAAGLGKGNGKNAPKALHRVIPKGEPDAVYDFTDEKGTLLFQACRYGHGPSKTFKYRRPDGNGGWIWSLGDVRRVPYRLPEILKVEALFIVEGEKDADALKSLGYPATSSKNWRPEWSEFFRGKTVYIIPDNDMPGIKIASNVAKSFYGRAEAVYWVELPGLPPGGDVSDFIKARGAESADTELAELLTHAQKWIPQESTQNPGFKFLSIQELLAGENTPEWVIEKRLDSKSLAMIYGGSGTMKTTLALDIGLSVATGSGWHNHAIQTSGPVFYFCGEGFAGIGRRLKAWEITRGINIETAPFYVSNQPARMLDPTSVEEVSIAVDSLKAKHGPPVLILLDTLNRNFGPGDENSTADMTAFISALDNFRNRFNCAILLLHHTGHTSTERARGASSLRAALDWEYRLELATDGGTRILTCTKSKDFEPPAPMSFRPEIILLDDEGVVSSVVLMKVDGGASIARRPLTGAKKIALDSLLKITLKDGTGSAHIDTWREAAYKANISNSDDPSAKRKAFTRAVAGLRDTGHIELSDDYARLIAGQPDRTGTNAGHVLSLGGQ